MDKRIIKNRKKQVFAIMLAIFCVIVLSPAKQVLAAVTNDSTASITVNNVTNGDAFKIYKVIDISYDAATNTMTQTWNSDFASYFEEEGLTVEAFAGKTSGEVKQILSGLDAFITTKTISETAEEAAADQKVTFAGLNMGAYYIKASVSKDYGVMFQSVEATAGTDGTYTLNSSFELTAKKQPAITKTSDVTSAKEGDYVKFTVVAEIPQYDSHVTGDKKTFKIKDTLPEGLQLVTDDATHAITVQVKATGAYSAADESWYTLDTALNTLTLDAVVAQYDNLAANKEIKIEYYAKLTEQAIIGATGNTNGVVFTYTSENGTTDVIANASKTIYTYGITVDKFEKDEEATKLQNAKFDLYLENATAEDTIPGTSVKGIKINTADVVTDANGAANIDRIAAGTYYLVETAAPAGYNMIENPIKIAITGVDGSGDLKASINDASTDATVTDRRFVVPVADSKGFLLPSTGGMGTVLFTVLGIALMLSAIAFVFVLIFAKKKKVTK